MKNAIIIHGSPSKEEYGDGENPISQKHWIPWVKKELTVHGISVETPDMPIPYNPMYESWREVFEGLPINKETILVGHSSGGGFLLRWLSENKAKVGAVVLVAPWIDPDKTLDTGFFDFEIDSELVVRTNGVTVFVSEDDDREVLDSVQTIIERIPNIEVKKFSDQGHFTEKDMGTVEFPELIDVLVG